MGVWLSACYMMKLNIISQFDKMMVFFLHPLVYANMLTVLCLHVVGCVCGCMCQDRVFVHN